MKNIQLLQSTMINNKSKTDDIFQTMTETSMKHLNLLHQEQITITQLTTTDDINNF